jgi:2-oxoglutarate ferredoxin oxidoreductase subunit beta
MNVETSPAALTAKDFASNQEVRWCPGCGDYAILRAVQKTLADVGARPENTVFVSGIGCAARFPYYVATYGFHTIHGRAPAFATGIKLANPELDVWVISGDGDALSIGGNHLIHLLRRNVDVQFLLFNNEIYGLTKGQYSPTSRAGTRSPSTPTGSVDSPLSATQLALGAGARFVARGIDTQQKALPEILARAYAHKGTSFVEILQNCVVYNDGVFSAFTEKAVAEQRQIYVRHGEPLVFGAEGKMGLRLKPGKLQLEVVSIGENGIDADDILVHDETDRALATMLATLGNGHGEHGEPVAVGVIYCNPAPSYEAQVHGVTHDAGPATAAEFNAFLRRGNTWTVEG